MNSYAIYRIAETLRVLVFITLVILIFNFFPVTAIQIVMLALLHDGAILSIAYDNVHYKDQPEAWNMRFVLGMATVLGVVGPVAAFGLFYLGGKVFHLDHAHLQTLMYLTLSVAGHLTIFLARTRRPFWSIRPARILLMAVVGTQMFATLIAVYGVFMTPLGWGYAAVVWGYALVWFLVTDRVKLLAYRILDPVKAKGVVTADTPTLGHSSPADLPEKSASTSMWPRSIQTPILRTPCITTTATVPMARRSSATTTTSPARTVAAGVTGAPSMPSSLNPGSVREDVAVTRSLPQRLSLGLRCSLWAPTRATVGPDVPRSEASGEICCAATRERTEP
jgi:hypothetical protein